MASSSTPQVNRFITRNSADNTLTHFVEDTSSPITAPQGPDVQISYIYSALPTPSLADDADLKHHSEVSKRERQVSFPAAGGSSAVVIHFAPNPTGAEGFMHRTNTLDYMLCLEGEGEYTVNGGEKRVVKKGDAIVQRAGWHALKNLSKTNIFKVAGVSIGAKGAVENGLEMVQA